MSIPSEFKALIVREFGKPAEISDIGLGDLSQGDVTVKVAFSSLNYKDGMSVTSKGKILRNFPIVPWIDLAGTVVESELADFSTGEKVLINGYGIGEEFTGGYAQSAQVKSEWLVRLLVGLS